MIPNCELSLPNWNYCTQLGITAAQLGITATQLGITATQLGITSTQLFPTVDKHLVYWKGRPMALLSNTWFCSSDYYGYAS